MVKLEKKNVYQHDAGDVEKGSTVQWIDKTCILHVFLEWMRVPSNRIV